MITLYGFGPAFGLADPSPFVVKTAILLKMAGLEFVLKQADFRKSPKGKIPYIADEGVTVPDSTFIRRHLETRHGADFSGGYSPADLAAGLAFERMCEDHLYWGVVDARWMVRENYEAGPAIFFKSIPALIRPLIVGMIQRKVARNLKGQGFGLHSRAEIETLCIADINAIAAFLGDKPYLLGPRPSGPDATIYAFMASNLCPLFKSPITEAARGHANIVAYVARMEQQFYPAGFAQVQ